MAYSLFVFLPPSVTGCLIVHLLWSEREGLALLLKLSLGIGVGLGINSILYFLSLLLTLGRPGMLAIQLGLLSVLFAITILRERKENWHVIELPHISRLQWGLLGLAFIALALSILVFFNMMEVRPQGAFDAWSIWNRAARFIYRDPNNWQATLSPDLYWGTHADYPLLIPLNVAWGWEAIGMESPNIPMVQSALFLFASIGLIFASMGLVRTLGQASLASLVIMGTPIFLSMGSGLISDVPVTYFIFAASFLIFYYFILRQSSMLFLSGFMAGLAAWTKNEGLLFVAVSIPVLLLTIRKDMPRSLSWYLAGLAIPFITVLYFKFSLAPASDLFAYGGGEILAKIADPSRYWIILNALKQQFFGFAGWPISIFIQLAIYGLLMRFHPPVDSYRGTIAVAIIILLQLLGYCAVFVLTPHDLQWHLDTALERLILQVYPVGIFLFFSLVSTPEDIGRELPLPNKTK